MTLKSSYPLLPLSPAASGTRRAGPPTYQIVRSYHPYHRPTPLAHPPPCLTSYRGFMPSHSLQSSLKLHCSPSLELWNVCEIQKAKSHAPQQVCGRGDMIIRVKFHFLSADLSFELPPVSMAHTQSLMHRSARVGKCPTGVSDAMTWQ